MASEYELERRVYALESAVRGLKSREPGCMFAIFQTMTGLAVMYLIAKTDFPLWLRGLFP
jgi:hypothetical protein